MLNRKYSVPALINTLRVISLFTLFHMGPCWGGESSNPLLARTIHDKLQAYSELYPDIAFVVLSGGNKLPVSMKFLSETLGDEPTSLDYEHPEEFRQDLNVINIARIERMLSWGLPSATLFGVGANAKINRPKVCIVTLDVERVARDKEQATHFLLSLPVGLEAKIPVEHWIDNVAFLRYVLDHEIYHCLDSSINGPIPMSDKEMWAEYKQYYNNLGAGAYAMMMYVARTESTTTFVNTIYSLRVLSVLSGDVEHYNAMVIHVFKNMPIEKLRIKGPRDLFEWASSIRANLDPGYESYLALADAAKQVLRRLGLVHNKTNETGRGDDSLADSIAAEVRTEYKKLFNVDMPRAGIVKN